MIDMTQWAGKIHWLILFFVCGILLMVFPRKVMGWTLPLMRAIRDAVLGEPVIKYPTADEAPHWASCTAQDMTGEWKWHREFPTYKDGYWSSISPTIIGRAGISKPIRHEDSVILVSHLKLVDWKVWENSGQKK